MSEKLQPGDSGVFVGLCKRADDQVIVIDAPAGSVVTLPAITITWPGSDIPTLPNAYLIQNIGTEPITIHAAVRIALEADQPQVLFAAKPNSD